jgi:hypothetical protein
MVFINNLMKTTINKIPWLFAVISALACLALTISGLLEMSWPSVLPWQGKAPLFRYLGYMVTIAVVVCFISQFTRQSVLLVGSGVCIAGVVLAGTMWPLIVPLWFFLASCLLGRRALITIGIDVTEINAATTFLVGAGLYASLVSIVAHFPINFPGIYSVGLLLPLLLDRRGVRELTLSFSLRLRKPTGGGAPRYWLDIGLVVLAAVYLTVALLPEVGYDPLVTHLFVPSQLAQRHAWGFDASLYALAVIPMLADWIYAINYMLGGEAAARLVNVGFIFVLSFLVRDLAIWAGGSDDSGRLAGLILLSTPLSFLEGSTLHVEGVWAAFLVGATLSILRLTVSDSEKARELVVAGMLLGCALATKAITLLMLPALGGLLLWKWRSWALKELFWAVLLGSFLLLVLGAIPYVDAWRMTGNPVFPFFNKIFQSPLFPVENFKDMRWQAGFTADMLYAMTFHSERYQEAQAGAPGFQWLVLLVPSFFLLIGCKSQRGLFLFLLGIVWVAFVFSFTATYFRYVFPATVLLIAAMAVAIERGFQEVALPGRVILSAGLLVVLALNMLFLNAASWYGDFQIRPIFDSRAREAYLVQRLPERAAVELVNKLNTAENPVAVVAAPFIAGLKSDALLASWYNRNFLDALLRVRSDIEAFNLLVERSVDYVILDKNWLGPSGHYDAQRGYLEGVTTEVAAFGPISVRKIDPALRFRQELLKNSDFSSKEGWSFSPGVFFDSSTHSVLVSESAPVTQSVAVKAGRQYRNVVVARCAARPAEGRLQINWHGPQGSFLKADVIAFDCSADWTEHEMIIVAPPSATMAVVYTSGHTSESLAYRLNSLLE